MQLAQTVNGASLPSHRHHLEDGRLCAVVGVFGSAFALRNPDVVVLLAHHVVHILRHLLARHEELPRRERALHDERLVESYEVFHPWQRQQIVADGNLACGVEASVIEQHVEERRIEHDVTMVAHKGVTLRHVHRLHIHVEPLACLCHKVFQKTIAESELELQVRLACHHLCLYRLQWHSWIKISEHLLELCVREQAFKGCRQLFGVERTYIVVNGWSLHNE